MMPASHGAIIGQNTANSSHSDRLASAEVAVERKIDREQHRDREPHAAVGDRRDQEQQAAHDLLEARRQADQQHAETHHEQPQRDQEHRQRGEAGQEFSDQQRVAVDRLRQDAAHRAAVELAVDRIEAERDRHDRDQEAEERQERRQRLRETVKILRNTNGSSPTTSLIWPIAE